MTAIIYILNSTNLCWIKHSKPTSRLNSHSFYYNKCKCVPNDSIIQCLLLGSIYLYRAMLIFKRIWPAFFVKKIFRFTRFSSLRYWSLTLRAFCLLIFKTNFLIPLQLAQGLNIASWHRRQTFRLTSRRLVFLLIKPFYFFHSGRIMRSSWGGDKYSWERDVARLQLGEHFDKGIHFTI